MAPAAQSSTAGSPPKTKRLTKDVQEELNRKLYEASMEKQKKFQEGREKALNDECGFPPTRKLKPEAQESLMQHLYNNTIEQMQRAKEKRELELKKANEIPTKQLSEAEMLDSIDRMYYQEKTKRNTNQQKLLGKYQPKTARKRLDGDEVAAINERLFDSTKGRFEKLRGELWEKHISPMEPTFPKLTAAQQASVSDRLSSKGG